METSLASMFVEESQLSTVMSPWPTPEQSTEELEHKLVTMAKELEATREADKIQKKLSFAKLCHYQNLLESTKKERDEALQACNWLKACLSHFEKDTIPAPYVNNNSGHGNPKYPSSSCCDPITNPRQAGTSTSTFSTDAVRAAPSNLKDPSSSCCDISSLPCSKQACTLPSGFCTEAVQGPSSSLKDMMQCGKDILSSEFNALPEHNKSKERMLNIANHGGLAFEEDSSLNLVDLDALGQPLPAIWDPHLPNQPSSVERTVTRHKENDKPLAISPCMPPLASSSMQHVSNLQAAPSWQVPSMPQTTTLQNTPVLPIPAPTSNIPSITIPPLPTEISTTLTSQCSCSMTTPSLMMPFKCIPGVSEVCKSCSIAKEAHQVPSPRLSSDIADKMITFPQAAKTTTSCFNNQSKGPSALPFVLPAEERLHLIEANIGTVARPLPQKGKLLEAVVNAGPLLQQLLLTGPLPHWQHPPQDLRINLDMPKKKCSTIARPHGVLVPLLPHHLSCMPLASKAEPIQGNGVLLPPLVDVPKPSIPVMTTSMPVKNPIAIGPWSTSRKLPNISATGEKNVQW